MPNDELTFAKFSLDLMRRSHLRMLEAIDGLTDEQLWFQPAPSSNSIGWLVWHLSRFKDLQTARVADEPQVWVLEGWAEKFGLSNDATGLGDGPNEIAAFRVDRTLLLGYAKAAHEAAVRRVRSATQEQLLRELGSSTGKPRPAYERLLTNAVDYTEHTGQIAYLRGVLTGPGWSKTMS